MRNHACSLEHVSIEADIPGAVVGQLWDTSQRGASREGRQDAVVSTLRPVSMTTITPDRHAPTWHTHVRTQVRQADAEERHGVSRKRRHRVAKPH
jgi:hypothetical protein